ncbi:MAG: hypothetical protein JSR77_17550 [Planctomycetes bacterium]|nr:hypothetical protein [Planctomycetota bacterium]
MTRLAYILALLTFALVGCTTPPALHANMTDPVLRTKLAESFQPGMTLDQVQGGLDTLHIDHGRRMLYAPEGERPQVLLARLFPPGGFWGAEGDSVVEWVDVSFVFEPTDHLSRTLLYRDGMRYFYGDPVNKPNREPMARFPRWPALPPPPKNPLEGAT